MASESKSADFLADPKLVRIQINSAHRSNRLSENSLQHWYGGAANVIEQVD
jgi:hypothetical protein